jgi:hypothetical protein
MSVQTFDKLVSMLGGVLFAITVCGAAQDWNLLLLSVLAGATAGTLRA